jgi:MoaA/NifB/PqqE/SkfB family radical SAM enzyme
MCLFKAFKKKIKESALSAIAMSERFFSPRAVDIDSVWYCNINCVMCSHKNIQLGHKELAPREFQRILQALPKLKYVNFIGLGEPLANPHFFELLDLAASKKIKVIITTNATLWNEANIKRIRDNIAQIIVSIDSPHKEGFESLRPGAKFESLIENLKRIKGLKKRIDLRIQAVLMQENIKDLPDLIELAHSLGIKHVALLHILSLDRTNDQRFLRFTQGAAAYLKRAERLAKEYKIELLSRPLEPQMRPCREPWLLPFIGINGDIYPCCFIYRIPESFTEWYAGVPLEVPLHQYRMGNIFQDSFKDIWNNRDFRLLRRTIRQAERMKKKKLSVEEYNSLRKKMDPNERFSYCRFCLWRWSVAC